MSFIYVFAFWWFPPSSFSPSESVRLGAMPPDSESAPWSVSSYVSHTSWLGGATLQWPEGEPGEGGAGSGPGARWRSERCFKGSWIGEGNAGGCGKEEPGCCWT